MDKFKLFLKLFGERVAKQTKYFWWGLFFLTLFWLFPEDEYRAVAITLTWLSFIGNDILMKLEEKDD
ncbi:MAG: hypothetical protein GOVbin4162_61 [Prokaryotic dsDNA virus sp.]|nr:MAG: hypothetical protein GOVbin4162_61 [Prokaryotic dsDNA virus sp.]|tara:strand:- start:489 stop:689 length:201 start_codon:yes stop_codon:yes gene_type:complete